MKIELKRYMKALLATVLSLVIALNGIAGYVSVVDAGNAKQYKEMKFGDWTEKGTTGLGARKYELTDKTAITSLDGVAISGKINFNGTTNKYLTFGGTDTLTHGGFWIKVSGEGALSLMCQGVAGVQPNEVKITNAAFKLNEEFTLRVTFDHDTTNKKWTMTVYADGTLLGSDTFDFSSATGDVGLYIGIPKEFSVDMTPSSTESKYKEMKFGDWTEKGTTGIGARKYELTDKTAITSLDGVAISGKINFNGTTNKYLTFGGTDTLTHGGFWIKVSGEGALSLMCQGVAGVQPNEVKITNAAFKLNEEFTLRVTFDHDKTNKKWTMMVYADGTLLGSDTFDFSSATGDVGLYIGIPKEFTVDMTPSSVTPTYTEMKFSDWGKQAGTNGMGYNKYELTDASAINSLAGVAISGKVNFNGVTGKYLTFGGTDKLDHAGLWIKSAGEGKMELMAQGIANVSATGVEGKYKFENAAFKINQEINLRVTFDHDTTAKTWTVTVYADGVLVGSNTFDFSSATENLKLYIGVPQEFTVDMTSSSTPIGPTEPSGEYTEKTLSEWSAVVGKLYGFNVYRLANAGSLTSLDGVAVSGTVNYNGIEKAIFRIGGNESAKHAGFAFMDNGGCFKLVTQSIGGDATPRTILDKTEWNELKAKEFELRVTFDRDADTGKWSLGVFINNEYKGSYDCGTANPGMYLACDDNVTIKMQAAQSPDDKVYTELRFEDWGIYCGIVSGMDIYRLKGHDDITSLHGVAISGKVNFNGASRKYIAVGGTEKLKNGGFWLGAVEENWWLVAPQGIGGTNQPGTLLSKAGKFKDEVNVRMTFWQEAANIWTIGVYADGVYVGSYTCEDVEPGLYLGVNPLVTVEGLGDTVKNAGLDFTLFGYGNDTWRKEMGLE